MDKQAKIALLEQNSYAFEVDLTLDEIEWTRILGPNGLGDRLLHEMVAMGGDFFEMKDAEHQYNRNGEVMCFRLEGAEHHFRLNYDQPFVANLQAAVRQVLDEVNAALRRQTIPFRFVCVRDSCTGAGSTYRLILMPTPWLAELEDELNIVSGISLEDYEAQRSFPGADLPITALPNVNLPDRSRQDVGGGPLEAR